MNLTERYTKRQIIIGIIVFVVIVIGTIALFLSGILIKEGKSLTELDGVNLKINPNSVSISKEMVSFDVTMTGDDVEVEGVKVLIADGSGKVEEYKIDGGLKLGESKRLELDISGSGFKNVEKISVFPLRKILGSGVSGGSESGVEKEEGINDRGTGFRSFGGGGGGGSSGGSGGGGSGSGAGSGGFSSSPSSETGSTSSEVSNGYNETVDGSNSSIVSNISESENGLNETEETNESIENNGIEEDVEDTVLENVEGGLGYCIDFDGSRDLIMQSKEKSSTIVVVENCDDSNLGGGDCVSIIEENDVCLDENRLNEMTCFDGEIVVKELDCQNGCLDGRCL